MQHIRGVGSVRFHHPVLPRGIVDPELQHVQHWADPGRVDPQMERLLETSVGIWAPASWSQGSVGSKVTRLAASTSRQRILGRSRAEQPGRRQAPTRRACSSRATGGTPAASTRGGPRSRLSSTSASASQLRHSQWRS
ncbi:unnamed protein product [Prorocentrum cordatum]|uniref:Uncharacterized protein n=1 Tax=Prorocentrum cordatum TaxID=2364126 RepID=A0ABN9RMT4_9DINO|nr:unnamed protein product [Polarella glacialis]